MVRNSKDKEVPEVIGDKCIGCQICVGECPVGAIELDAQGVAQIDPEVCVGCGRCSQVCPVEAIRWTGKARAPRRTAVPKEAGIPHGGVAVFLEVRDGICERVSWELVGRARELASKLKAPVWGFLLGHGVESLASDAVHYGCDEVHVVDHPELAYYRSRPFGEAISMLCLKLKPEILLLGATATGRDLSPVAATLLKTGLTADCTALEIDEQSGLLLMTRPTFGGNIMATIFCQRHRPQMSTVRPMVFPLPSPDTGRKGAVTIHPWIPAEAPLPHRISWTAAPGGPAGEDITKAPALVVAGRGACTPEALPLLEELAEAIGATVACSRPVVEAGLMPYERQVGQTGKTVAPRLYIGVGVSGAVQHLVGMQGSERIVAINLDPTAPIFQVADVGIVGDYREVIPALIQEIRDRRDGTAGIK